MAAGSDAGRSPGAVRRYLALALALGAACTPRPAGKTDASDKTDAGVAPSDPVAQLRPFEEATRRAFDFERPPSAETGLGADPWSIRRVVSSSRGDARGWVGILRGRSSLVLLDEDLHELARVPCPRSPTGLAVASSGEIFVTGELSPEVARFAVRGASLHALAPVHVPGAMGLRDVAVSPSGAVWALDDRGERVVRVGANGAVTASLPAGHGASQVIATDKHVLVDAITDHEIVVFTTDPAGRPMASPPQRIKHDGPFWGMDARETEDGLVIVAGGVEDHPLDRTVGFFGYIDSFVFAYRVHDASIETLATLDVSEHGAITPKAIAVERADAAGVDALVASYGSDTGLRVAIRVGAEPRVTPLSLVPGIRSATRDLSADTAATATTATAGTTAMADPLLDAWVLADEHGARVVPVPALAGEPPRATASRLGEALFFTSLMAPKNTSAGAHSRFTCETCHFEGYVDGRTHHTGRQDVHATTKPLVGLIGNRPYFSRALDPDLSTVTHAEFRVAGAGSGTDPFFTVTPKDHPWLAHLGVHASVAPLELRRALMRFLGDNSHRPNSAVVARAARGAAAFDALERDGAILFRDRCERCHAARLVADDPKTRVPFERWESMIFREAAPIVWGSAGYAKTGITPYVHEEGARTPSLRRLYKKYPYFTNGSAASIGDVLDRMRWSSGEALHGGGPSDADRLDIRQKRALRAFLDLL